MLWGSVEHVFRSPDWNGKGWYRILSPAGIYTIRGPNLRPKRLFVYSKTVYLKKTDPYSYLLRT